MLAEAADRPGGRLLSLSPSLSRLSLAPWLLVCASLLASTTLAHALWRWRNRLPDPLGRSACRCACRAHFVLRLGPGAVRSVRPHITVAALEHAPCEPAGGSHRRKLVPPCAHRVWCDRCCGSVGARPSSHVYGGSWTTHSLALRGVSLGGVRERRSACARRRSDSRDAIAFVQQHVASCVVVLDLLGALEFSGHFMTQANRAPQWFAAGATTWRLPRLRGSFGQVLCTRYPRREPGHAWRRGVSTRSVRLKSWVCPRGRALADPYRVSILSSMAGPKLDPQDSDPEEDADVGDVQFFRLRFGRGSRR